MERLSHRRRGRSRRGLRQRNTLQRTEGPTTGRTRPERVVGGAVAQWTAKPASSFAISCSNDSMPRTIGWAISNSQNQSNDKDQVEGVSPADRDGADLNLGFEQGSLVGWTATGDAFDGQPVRNDGIASRWAGQTSNKSGDYFIGGYRTGSGPRYRHADLPSLRGDPSLCELPGRWW